MPLTARMWWYIFGGSRNNRAAPHRGRSRLLVTGFFCSCAQVFALSASSQDELAQPVFVNGAVDPLWSGGIRGFDEANNNFEYDCINDGGADCPSLSWGLTSDESRGQALQIEWMGGHLLAGLFFKSLEERDFSEFLEGYVSFDIRSTTGQTNIIMKVDCVFPCSSGEIPVTQTITDTWQQIDIPVSTLRNQGLNLSKVDTGLVIWPTGSASTVLQIDNVRWRAPVAEPPLDSGSNDSPLFYGDFDLVWSDEFSGSVLNTNYWSYDLGGGGWGNNEWQDYRVNNTGVADGYMSITARQESSGGYTSSRIKTQGVIDFTYGRIDIRAKLPRGQGIWPALWSLGSNFESVGWPNSGEIDIMEMVGGGGKEDTVHGTVHWNADLSATPYAHAYVGGEFTGDDFSAGFNVFSIIRTADLIEWRVNNIPYYQFAIDESAPLAAFRKPFFLIFNIAVGGIWPGYPDATTVFPQRMLVDYVRIFEPKGGTLPQDTDGDGLSDAVETALGTDPNIEDTDADGLGDGQENELGTDPLNQDSDEDGLSDGTEVSIGTNPNLADTDGDGLSDGDEVSAGSDPLSEEGEVFNSTFILILYEASKRANTGQSPQ